MQTFLPYGDFKASAACLDRQRLGKQRSEGMTLLETLIVGKVQWSNHPACVMWRGAEISLWKYVTAICLEWQFRGYEDTVLGKVNELMMDALKTGHLDTSQHTTQPWWLGKHGFHVSHQSNLIRKDPEFYRPLWPRVPDNFSYVWPEWRPPVPVSE